MPYIHLRTARIEYEFSFDTKFLIISGDSGTGKSTLVNLVAQYANNNEAVKNDGDNNIYELTAVEQLDHSGDIFFIDESNSILWLSNASSLFNSSDNYFVIVVRDRKITQFKLALKSLVRMKISENGRYHTIEEIYPRTEHLESIGECIICEDEKSGKQFLEKVLNCKIEAAQSNTKIGLKMRKLKKSSYTIVFDKVGIGYLYEDILLISNLLGCNVTEIDWDSFESYVLESSEYNCSVPIYPDKERNATTLFKKLICKDYDKSNLPNNMKLPVYWKIKDAKELLNKAKKKYISKIDVF